MTAGAPHGPGIELGLEGKVALLLRPETYPEYQRRIDTIQTHMSWVFLTPRHAYKLKKPVRYEFLDFSTLEARRLNCLEELRLNARLAPDVYLAVVPLAVGAGGQARLEGAGEVVEWLVKMRRLPSDRMLDEMIRRRALAAGDIRHTARVLAEFYREARGIPMSGAEYRAQYEQNIHANFQALAEPAYGLPADLLQTIHSAQLRLLRDEPGLFDRRAEAGRVIEGHGDLRPEHVCLEPHPVIFDRLEFNRRFRILDAADELAFLAMECDRLEADFVGPELFRVYAEVTGDAPPPALIAFYKSHRACLRAKLAILHTRELAPEHWPRWRALAEEYLRLGDGYSVGFPAV